MTAADIREFYNKNPFPGPYTIEQLRSQSALYNRYIRVMDRFVGHDMQVLDVGCGTGLITNLLALRYRSNFTGLDFSTGIEFARDFAQQHSIQNAQYMEIDFFDYNTEQKFDVIICQSFLTHVPAVEAAIDKLKALTKPAGVVLLGVYNTYGKVLQKFRRLDYGSSRLELDQEHNPYENKFSHQETLRAWRGFEVLEICPSFKNRLVDFCNVFNSKNGGLTLYALRRSNDHQI